MPEVRPPSLADKLGTAVARTSGGVSQGAGQAVELARMRSNSGSQSSAQRSIEFNGDPSGPHANGATVGFTIPDGSWYLTMHVAWEGTVTGGPTPQSLYAKVTPAPGPFHDVRNATQLTGPGVIDVDYTLAEIVFSGGAGGVTCVLHAPEATTIDAEFTLTIKGLRAP